MPTGLFQRDGARDRFPISLAAVAAPAQRVFRTGRLATAAGWALLLAAVPAGAQTTLYWPQSVSTGTWETASLSWSTVSSTSAADTNWVNGSTTHAAFEPTSPNNYDLTLGANITAGSLGPNASVGSLDVNGSGLTLNFTTFNPASALTQLILHNGTFVASATTPLASGTVNLNSVGGAGTLRLTGLVGGTVAIAVAAGSQVAFDHSGLATYSGVISGAGFVTKAGIGTLHLLGANTYTGGTALTGGILIALNNSNLGDAAGPLNFTGGTLQLDASFAHARDVTLGAGGGTVDTVGYTGVWSGVISGSTALTKTGTGVLTLAGANTYSSDTVINEGTLQVGDGATAGSIAGNAVIGSGATLRFNRTDNVTYGSVISGAGGVSKVGTGTLTLGGTNTYSGGTTLGAGALSVSSNVNLGDGAGSLIFSGGQLQLGASFDHARDVTINPAAGTLASNGFNATWSGVLSGTGPFTKSGAGTLTLSGANTYTGNTMVNAGTLKLGANHVLADTTAVSVAVGGILDVNGRTDTIGSLAGSGNVALGAGALTTGANNGLTVFSGVIADAGSLTKTGTGTFTLGGTNTYTGGTTISGGTLRIGSGGASGTIVGDVSVASGTTLAFERSNAYNFSGVIAGAGQVVQAGSGTLALGGVSTYSGGTVINAGTLSASANFNLGDAAGTLTFGGGALQLGASFNHARAVTLNSGGGTVDTNGHNAAWSGIVSGSGALTKTGVGTLALSGTNTFTGSTGIAGGTLAVSANANLGHTSGGLVFSGGTLKLDGAFDHARNVTLGPAGGTVDSEPTSVWSGVISGTGGLTKAGTGFLTLSGANTYSGGTTITQGAIVVTSNANLGAIGGPLTMDGGHLQLSASFDSARNVMLGPFGGGLTVLGTTTWSGVISGPGQFSVSVGDVYLTGTNTYAGGTIVNSGAILGIGNGGTMGSIAGNVNLAGGALHFNRSDAITFPGAISGSVSGSITTAGTGTVTLTGSNTYSGRTEITNGDLRLGADGTIGDTSSVVVSANRTLDVNGRTETIGSLDSSQSTATVDLNGGTLTIGADNTSTTFAGTITGADFGFTDPGNNLVKIGSGTLTLTGTNDYEGITSINGGTLAVASAESFGELALTSVQFDGGTLQLNSSFNIGLSRAVTLNAGGGSVDTNGNTSDWGMSIGGSGGLTKLGSGTLTLSGTNTYTGGTTINAGTLKIGLHERLADSGDVHLALLGTFDINGNTETINCLTGSGTLVLGGGTLNVNDDCTTFMFSGIFSGPGAIAKLGPGTWTLGGDNTPFSGNLQINFGVLMAGTLAGLGGAGSSASVGSNGTLGAGFALNQAFLAKVNSASTGTVALGADSGNALDFASLPDVSFGATGPFTYSGALTPHANGYRLGGGKGQLTVSSNLTATKPLTVVGGGSVLLTGVNTYNGGTNVQSGGVLSFGSAGSIGGTGANVTVQAGGVVAANYALDQAFLGRINNTSTGAVALGANSGNNLDFNTAGLPGVGLGATGNYTFSGALTPAPAGYRLGGGGGTLTLPTGLVGSNSLTVVAGGTVVLTGGNTYTGGTTIAGGVLRVDTDARLGASNGPLTLNAGGTLNGTGSFSSTRGTTLGPGGGGFSVDGAQSLTWNGAIGGTGLSATLNKTGSGTLVLASANSYEGGTLIAGGKLLVGAENRLGAALQRVTFDGGTLEVSATMTTQRPGTLGAGGGTIVTPSGTTLDWNGPIDGLGSLTKIGPGSLQLGGGNIYVGDTYVNEGTLKIMVANALSPNTKLNVAPGANFDANGFAQTFSDLTGSGNLNVGAAGLAVQPSGTSTFSGALQGSGGFTMAGTGTLLLSGANTFTGTTAIQAGTVKLGAPGALPANSPVQLSAGATLDLNGNAATLGQLAGAGNVALGGAALTLNQSGNTTFSGAIQGTGGFNKQGAGVLTLGGANTFSGPAAIEAGTLKLGAPGALPALTPVVLSSGATLDLDGNPATLGKLAGAGNVTLGSATLTVTQTESATFSGTITGTGGLAKGGSGLLILGGTQSFTGQTSVTGGELKVTGSAATSPFNVTGGILSGTGTVGTLTVASGGTLAPGSSPGLLTVNGDLSLSGTTEIEIAGLARGVAGGYDAIDVVGGNITSGGTLTVTFLDGFSPATGASFNVFDWTGSSTGSFATLNLATLTSGLSWDSSALYTSGVLSVTGTAIPEPGTYAAFAGLLVLGLAAWRRRRSSAVIR